MKQYFIGADASKQCCISAKESAFSFRSSKMTFYKVTKRLFEATPITLTVIVI